MTMCFISWVGINDEGIEVDPNNKALWAAMQACKDASEQDRDLRHASAAQDRALEEERIRIQDNMKRYHEEEKRRQEEAKKEEDMMNSFFSDIAADDASGTGTAAGSSHAVEEANEGDDDLLADFFNEVTETTNRSDATAVAKAEALEAKDQNTLTEKYSNQVLEDGKHQYERLLAPHFEWRNLNPYFVFQLGVDATDEDIKYRYKKLSLKVHPDRLRGVDNPNDAFEQVKLAYAKLCDQDQRKNIIYHVERITEEVTKERRKLIGKGVDIDKLPDVTAETDRRVMKHFAEMERMRRRSETNLRAYSARDKMKEAEEHAKISKAMERDKSWGEENRREKRVGNWREFQDDPDSKKAKASSYKEESREEKKHGTVKVETWKKSWK